MRALDLSKYKNPPAREIITSCPTPSVTENSPMANIIVAINTPSPAKRCKRWGPPYLFCVQSAPDPSLVNSHCLEEDWDSEMEKEKRREK